MYAFEVPAWTGSCEVIAAMAIKQQDSFINLTVKDAMYLLSILQEWIVLNSDKFLLCCLDLVFCKDRSLHFDSL